MSTLFRIPILIVLVFILSITSTIGQRLWQSQGEPVLTPAGAERFIYADEAEYFELDTGIWQAVAARIPMEVERLNAEQGFAVEIPMPNGQTETFLLAESPIMESSLAGQYPEIKTYVGHSPNHPDWYGKFDFTPQGFHGMILGTSGGTVFIDPVFHGPLYPTSYIAYHRDHFISSATNIFSCDATNDVIDTSLDNGQLLGRFGSCELRTYRLALAATGEYSAFHGGTVALGLAAQNTTMNRVNGVFERDIAITMTIIANNNLLVYTNSGSDPYSNGNASTMLGQNQSNIDAVIGSANYDIGHVFGVGSGGIAGLGVVCSNSGKARGVTGSGSPVGDPFDIDYVAHEMGHQFSMNHTQNNNCNRNNATAMEPGSASTIMGYAGICAPNVQSNSDDYFHGISLEECGAFITSGSHTCPVKTTLSNSEPVISSTTSNVTIPANTPFSLTAIATDPDAGDILTYCWEQMDNQTGFTMPPSNTSTGGPMFRSLDPKTSPTRFFPDLQDLIAGSVSQWEVLPGVSRSMDFRVTVRDNASGGGCNDHADLTLTVDGSTGPFLVQNPNNTGITWDAATSETVTWDVAGTASGAVNCGNVDVLLSTDGGLTFSIIASNVPNSGSTSVNVPNSPTANGLIMVQCANGSFFDISDNTFTINQITNDYTISTATSNESVCAGGNVSYTIDLTAFGTFSDPISLSVSGGGTGTSANLSASNVTPTASVNLNVSTTLAASGSNSFTVTANSTTGTKTLDLFLDVLTTPSSPSLLAPVNGVTTANPATLTWSSAANETYDISVFSSINPNILFESATGLTSASYTTSALANSTTYYYQVTAVNTCGSATSAMDSFTTSTCLTYTNTTDYPGSTAAGTFVQSPITVSVSPTAQVSSLSIPNMQGDMTYISDLEIILVSPTGTQTSLIDYRTLCNNEDDWNHGLEDGGLNQSGIPCPPTDGLIYDPTNPFSSFNNELVDGDWNLIVYDYFTGDAATLTEWTMELCTFDPCGGGFVTNQSFSGCDSYVYNGTSYTSSTTVTENLTTANGCDSTVNTTITINPSATTNQSFTGCDSYVYNGTTYTSSTTVTENLTTANGCDSTVNTTITINPSVVTNLSFTECDSVVYNVAVYTVSGIYTTSFTASNGCDSIVNIQINILNEIGKEWAQIGQNIDGEASNDESGQSISFSRDATRLAIGAPLNDGNGSAAGHVRVFDWNGSSWVQLGQDIDGENSFDQSGAAISLSGDGNRIAIGARLFEPANAGTAIHHGHVRIFQWDGTSWTQLGQDINATRAQDEFGTAVSFSNDGNRIAIGGPGHDEVAGVNSNYGHVRVFDWDGSSWIQVGQDIDGPTTSNGRFGRSLCLSSDGSRLAVGSLNSRVKVYDWDGSSWTQIGPTLFDALNSGFGNSLSFSDDGISLAVGIPSGYSNGLRTGKVRAFQWDGVTWNRLGQDINGETDGEESGYSVSISSDGSRLAIGAKERSASLNRNGYVRIYDWDGSSWAQVGQDVTGESSFDRSGQSVALSKDGSCLAVGATGHDGPGFEAGHVKVYQLRGVTETAIFDTTNVIACDNYTWTINSLVYSTSGTYYDTLYGQSGCDSVWAVLNLTINPSTTTNQSFSGCDSYVYNGTSYTSSTTVTENLTTANGCDSTVNTTITINPSATTNQSFSGCDSYVYNGTTYTSSTTVTENLTTANGCDSTVNTTITINPSATTNQSFSGCDSYVYNGTTYISSTTVTENLFTVAGCDSTVNTTITITPSAATNQSFSGCDSYVYNGTSYTSSTTVTENLTTANGCDSTVNTTITINPSATTNQSFVGCDSYVYNGTTYTSSTTVTENLTTANGCDSTVNTAITINPSATTNQSFAGCDSYVYNGTSYTSSTTVTENLTTANGCDSTVNTTITINPSATTNQSFAGCDSYVYNGTSYTSSTTVTENLTTANGCDSTVNTTITINPSATTNQSFSGCDSYVYNGTTYTSSTTVTENLFTVNGCDSTVNTTITINPSVTTIQNFTACDSLSYNGTTYTSSTTVTENLLTIAGCDSTVNTTITINPSATTNQSFVGCDSYVYNGTTYTSSTTVTENLTTAAGCDSTVNTTITITPSPSPPTANGVSIVAGNSATLSASGAGSGQSYAWLTSNGTLVGNGASYTTPILNTTTIYFVEISDDASNCTSSRTTVIVTVTSPDILWTGNTSSDWNIASNWSTNLVPSLSDSVTIPSSNVINYPIIQNDVTVGHTTVEALASITIAPNGILRLSEELVNNGLVLLQSDISGDGVLMDTFTNASFVGSLSIERYNPGDQFHVIGSPVASSLTGLSNNLSGPTGNGLTGSDGIPVTPDLTTSIYLNSGVCDSLVIGSNYGNLFSYDESLVQNCSFEGWVVESAGTLVPGKGYMAYLTPGATIDLDGPPNTGSITGPSLTNSGGNTFTGAGWNLVSNPYPSFFDVEEFIVGNNGVNSPNVFVDTGLYSGTYSSILPVTGQSVVALGQGFVIRNGGDNAAPSINPVYSNTMRETSGTGFRSPANTRLKVDVIQENLRDKTEIYWAQGGREAFHRFEDGYKFKGLLHQPQIGSLLEDELMAVQTLPKSEDLSRIIPLVVNGIEASMYSIEVNPDFIPLAYHVFLIDNVEGRRYNARILPEIPFQNLGNEERRFDIEITKSSLHADNLDFLENIEVYQSNDQLIVAPQNASEAIYSIEVYDILGRYLMSKPLTAGRQVILLNTPSQLLNIRLSSGAHQHTVKTWWQVD